VKYWKRYKWYRKRSFKRYRSVIAVIWYETGRLKKAHLKPLRKKSTKFPGAHWKHSECADCRGDLARAEIATVSDQKGQVTVQNLKCHKCKKRQPWWWYSKLPLTESEEKIVQMRGKAW